jgi:hypothetical protein
MTLTAERRPGKRSVCLATWELKNIGGGGIGVFVHNVLRAYAADERVRFSVLWYGGRNLTASLFNRLHPNCDFFPVEDYGRAGLESGAYPERSSFAFEPHWTSLRLMLALKDIENRFGPFDVIEFPDFDGAAHATIQEKKLGRGFANATIAVRIHSTDSVLRPHDHRPILPSNAMRAALERKALADADVVVAHVKPVAAAVENVYGLGAGWLDKVRVEAPPVLVDMAAAESGATFAETTPIAFTSKIQWFKRPDVFVNGVVAFMRENADYRGSAMLLTHVIDDELRLHCHALVPDELKERVVFHHHLNGEARDRIIAQSVVVVPSAYESYCLAAYEAGRLGALLVLNESNPAFASDTPWEDGRNCMKFDGTAGGMAKALSRLWRSRDTTRLTKVDAPCARDPYWVSAQSPLAADDGERGLSCVVLVGDDLGDPAESVAALPRGPELDLQIVVAAEPCAEGTPRAVWLDRVRGMAEASGGALKFAELGFRGGEAALANLGLAVADKEHIAFVRAGAAFDPDFLAAAVMALRRNREFDFVAPQAVYCEGEKRWQRPPVLGEATSAATVRNMFSELEFVARRAAVAAVGFDESLDRFVDWDFHLRACTAGMRYLVSNQIEVRRDGEPPSRVRYWRSHLDCVFAKHAVSLGAAKVSVVSLYEGGGASIDNQPSSHAGAVGQLSEFAHGLRFSKRSLDYYLRESEPWWRVALTRPIKVRRWLMLREFQKAKRKLR